MYEQQQHAASVFYIIHTHHIIIHPSSFIHQHPKEIETYASLINMITETL
jgi:hypothetical protein